MIEVSASAATWMLPLPAKMRAPPPSISSMLVVEGASVTSCKVKANPLPSLFTIPVKEYHPSTPNVKVAGSKYTFMVSGSIAVSLSAVVAISADCNTR